MNVAGTLRKIADDLERLKSELDAGHEVDACHLQTAARRLRAQAEAIEEGLVG